MSIRARPLAIALVTCGATLASGCANDARHGAGEFSGSPASSSAESPSGASSGSPATPRPPTESPSTPKPRTPVIAGLPRHSRWSDSERAVDVYAVGNSIAIVRPGGKIEFRDAAGGAVRGEARTPLSAEQRFQSTTWHGAPALLSWYEQVTPSDGLSEEKRLQVVEAFDPSGHLLARLRWRAGIQKTVEDGWVITGHEDDQPAATITDEHGRHAHTITCTGLACAFDIRTDAPATLHDNGDAPMPLVLGGVYFTHEHVGDMGFSRLVAHDLQTGAPLWSTASVQKPVGVAAPADISGGQATPVAAVDGKILLSWVGPSEGILSGHDVLALHDARTGRLLVTGPKVSDLPSAAVFENAAQIAVVSVSTTNPRSTAWSMRTGTTLWSQGENEQPFVPTVAFGTTVLGYRTVNLDGSKDRPILLNVRSKHVIDSAPTNTSFTVSDNGKVAVLAHGRVFTFDSE